MKKWFLLFTCVLSACSIVDKPSTSIKSFMIYSEQKLPEAHHKKSVSINVVSDVPNNRPYIKITEQQMDFLADSEWFEPLDKMIARSFIHSFQNAGVTTFNGINSTAQSYVKIHVRHFGLEYVPGKKVMRVTYFVEVMDHARGTVLKSKIFEHTNDHLWISDQDYIKTLNSLHQELIKEIYLWI